jgi:copper chaperone CopZ
MRTELLKVLGMTCEGCITKITRALKATDGVGDVKVSLSSGEATVQYDERLTSPAQLQLAVTGAGYGVNVRATAAHPTSRGGCCG